MTENHWKSFQSLPDEDTHIRIIDGYNYVHPYVMRIHKGKLEARYDEMSPWEYVGIHCMNSIFTGYKWCYESQYTPEPLRDNLPPIFPQDHFLKWVTAYRLQTYNELLREYNDFCKDNPEKAAAL